VGFVFAESPRRVETSTVQEIIRELPPFVSTVGVFANQHSDEVYEIMEEVGLHFAQLHGEPISWPQMSVPWGLIRAIHIKSEHDIRRIEEYQELDPYLYAAFHLDSHIEGKMGGTGRVFDWNLAIQAKAVGKPIILAGGLTPENVAGAIQTVHPYAVDVSSGVEISPGVKDHRKIKEFVENATKEG